MSTDRPAADDDALPAAARSRRGFLAQTGMGLGAVALAEMLAREGLLAAPAKPPLGPVSFDLRPKAPPAAPRARAMISLFMHGGP
ncbi:MAG: hypothetical protein ACKO9B_10980, partial [Planctomycetota bacterium]